jgi:hypothetical protein
MPIMKKIVHVYPNGEPAHNTDGGECWCSPRVTHPRTGGTVVVHHVRKPKGK